MLITGAGLGVLAIRRTGTTVDREAAERSLPTAGRALVGAALALGLAWALVTPPFQVPDETSHVAYVQYLSESGKLPLERPGLAAYSDEQRAVLGALGFARIIGRPQERVIITPSEEAQLRAIERATYPPSLGNATTASANPPLYYALQAPIFLATAQGGLLTQLLAMRAFSVLLLAGSVGFGYLFARELLPNSPWTWTAGGMACAYQPVLGFIGSGVNPDCLLFLSATALFFSVARILRRGLTTRRAIFLASAVVAGLLTKPLFFALVPVAVVGLILAAFQHRESWRKPLLVACVLVVVPVGGVAAIGSAAFDHPYFAVAASVASGPDEASIADSTRAKQASFMLQLFLPRLPFLTDQIAGAPLQDVWIAGMVGVFGWVDYGFPRPYIVAGTWVFITLLLLTAVVLFCNRVALARSWSLLVCCLLGLIAVPAAVALIDYQALVTQSARFQQGRYMLPLLALYSGLFALAAKALGRRSSVLVLPVLWGLLSLHTLAAVLLTVNRYYI